MRDPIAKELVVVMIGKFNPAIITPFWLSGKQLISDLEAKEASQSSNFIAHLEVSQFSLEYCNIQTLQNKYTISSTREEYFDKIREITTGIFSYLPETPIVQIGINNVHHYRLNSAEEYKEFGDRLAPKGIWDPITKNPGLKSIEIQSHREDGFSGEINTKVGISNLPRIELGIRIQVNDHFNLYTTAELAEGRDINAQKSIDILERWEQSLRMSEQIISGVINHDRS